MFDRLFKWLNDLNPRQLLVLAGVVFFLMFGVIYFFLSWWTAKDEDTDSVTQNSPIFEMRTVVTAKSDIPPLTVMKQEMLELKEIPAEVTPSDAVGDMAKVLNTTAKTEILSGDVITERKLFSDLNQVTFVASIPPDCRAVSISVNEITGVDGFAKPGDRVDLLLVETDENFSATTNILLQDVLLLSINKNNRHSEGTKTDENGNITAEAIENPSTVTFALRPDEILKLISASKLGEIYLILRPINPTDKYFESSGYTINSINAYRQQQAATPPQPAPVQTTPQPAQTPAPAPKENSTQDLNKIEIIQGDKIVQ